MRKNFHWGKRKYKPKKSNSSVSNYHPKQATEIAKILKISLPTILLVPDILEYDGYVRMQKQFIAEEIPSNAQAHSGYFLPDRNSIYLADYYRDVRFDLDQYVLHNDADHILALAHELRHVWQYTFHKQKYYQNNALGLEIIEDESEIDADAFSLAYFLNSKSGFSAHDLTSGYLLGIILNFSIDNGKRNARFQQLSEEYHFDSAKKLEEAENLIDKNMLSILIAMIKLIIIR